MHPSAKLLMTSLIERYAPPLEGITVYDVGSYDVNGSYRQQFPHSHYVGLDIVPGSNVDVVVPAVGSWLPALNNEQAGLVISGSTLEHVEEPWLWIYQVRAIMRREAILIVTTHGQWPTHSYPVDCYRFKPDGLRALARSAELTVLDVGEQFIDPNGSDTWLVARNG